MRRMHSLVWVFIGAGVLALGGCSGSPTDSADINKLRADLKDANGQNEMLKKDTLRLTQSLKLAESSLLDTTDAKNKLQAQVDELTRSRDELTKSRDDLTKSRDELTKSRDDLTKSRDELTVKVNELGIARTGLQVKVDELTKAVDGLTIARTMLEKQVADLNKARNLALEDARSAQGKIEQLNTKIKIQTQQMTELQEQMVNIRAVLEHLQQNLQ